MTHEQNKCRCGRCVGIRLREAEARERILQQQNDAFDVIGADLRARIAALEEAARPVCEWMKAHPGEGLPNLRACVKRLAEVLEKGN